MKRCAHFLSRNQRRAALRSLAAFVVVGVVACSTPSASNPNTDGEVEPTPVELTKEDLGFTPHQLMPIPDGRFLICEAEDVCLAVKSSFSELEQFHLGVDPKLAVRIHGEQVIAYRPYRTPADQSASDQKGFYAALYDLEGNRLREWEAPEIEAVNSVVVEGSEIRFDTGNHVVTLQTNSDELKVEPKDEDLARLTALVDGDALYCSRASCSIDNTQLGECRRTGAVEWRMDSTWSSGAHPTLCGENFLIPSNSYLDIRSVRTGKRKAKYRLELRGKTRVPRPNDEGHTAIDHPPPPDHCNANLPGVDAIACADQGVVIAIRTTPETRSEVVLLSLSGDGVQETKRVEVPYRVEDFALNDEWIVAHTTHEKLGDFAVRRVTKLRK